jgi:hypothetical protein
MCSSVVWSKVDEGRSAGGDLKIGGFGVSARLRDLGRFG